MPNRIIAIGASAGGVEALMTLASMLPADLPAAVLIVMHVPPNSPSVMPTLLRRAGKLPAAHPSDGQRLVPGHIYVAPPDFHLLVHRGHVRLSVGPRENGHRPAVDPLFRTAARAYGARVVGVVLSGNLDDGTAGLQAIKSRGGVAVVQDPAEALYPGMPRSAMQHVAVDHVLPLLDMARLLTELAQAPVSEGEEPVTDELEHDIESVEMAPEPMDGVHRSGRVSALTCPECHGALWEIRDGEVIRYRCRTGHAFSAETLLDEQGKGLEAALWIALRALEEHAALIRRMTERARKNKHAQTVRKFEEQERTIEARAEVIRRLLATGPFGTAAQVEASAETSGVSGA
jgi:two-component system chemotaxis response regulator CheB